MIGLVLSLLLAAAVSGQPAEVQHQEPRDAASALLRHLLAESEIEHLRDGSGRDTVTMRSPGRPSDVEGICQRDLLSLTGIAEARDVRPNAAIREIELRRQFLVLADAEGRPRWQIGMEERERLCAAATSNEEDWFPAQDAFLARDGVRALLAITAALREPRSDQIQYSCEPDCPDRATLLDHIDPLRPRWDYIGFRDCPRGDWICFRVLLPHPECGGWSTQVRQALADRRFISAEIGYLQQPPCLHVN